MFLYYWTEQNTSLVWHKVYTAHSHTPDLHGKEKQYTKTIHIKTIYKTMHIKTIHIKQYTKTVHIKIIKK